MTGISLPPNTSPNLFTLAAIGDLCDSHFADIRDHEAITQRIKRSRPEVIFHLAAQPLVRASYRAPVDTFSTNVMGTVHVLEALRDLDSARVAVMITTDKVYRNNEWPWPYREDDALGGHDPYSASKAASELVIASYRDAFLKQQGVAVASARAGNVIGGGDWSEDRLIPDAVRAWGTGRTLEIRRPDAVRPWQHVLDPLAGYLALAERLWEQPDSTGAFNFGPGTGEVATVKEVIEMARSAFGGGDVRYGACEAGPHEAGWLALEVAKSRLMLGVESRWKLSESIAHTMAWYRSQNEGAEARALCEAQISAYENMA